MKPVEWQSLRSSPYLSVPPCSHLPSSVATLWLFAWNSGDFIFVGITGHSAILWPSTLQKRQRINGHSSLKCPVRPHVQHSSPLSLLGGEIFLLHPTVPEAISLAPLLDLHALTSVHVHGPPLSSSCFSLHAGPWRALLRPLRP